LDTFAGGNSNQVFNSAPEPNILQEQPNFSIQNYLQAQNENGRIPLPEGSPPPQSLNQLSTPNTVGGVIGANFPTNNNQDVEAVARPKPLNQNNQGSGFLAPVRRIE
jgi:hypothetical protein